MFFSVILIFFSLIKKIKIVHLITQSSNTDCLTQAIKVSRNFVHAQAYARPSKLDFLFSFLDFKLMLCMFGCLYKLQYEIRRPVYYRPVSSITIDQFPCSPLICRENFLSRSSFLIIWKQME
jgi:hypothetical protein